MRHVWHTSPWHQCYSRDIHSTKEKWDARRVHRIKEAAVKKRASLREQTFHTSTWTKGWASLCEQCAVCMTTEITVSSKQAANPEMGRSNLLEQICETKAHSPFPSSLVAQMFSFISLSRFHYLQGFMQNADIKSKKKKNKVWEKMTARWMLTKYC